ncbi:MAG: hypothetical protein ACI93R_004057 [Flavobacteriales bacterium]|jgi:hypothetical protein
MNIVVPKMKINCEASEELVRNVVSKLKEEPDSFAILSKDETNYVQVLMTENGFMVQFQNGSLNEHYEFDTYLSRPKAISIMLAYLNSDDIWQGELSYSKINTGGFAWSLGLRVGRFFGGLCRGFKEARQKT